MRTDSYGQIILDENDIVDLYLKDPETKLKKVITDTKVFVPNLLDLENIPTFITYDNPNISITDFDQRNQEVWYMPDDYKNIDIAQWVLEQCKDEAELQRAGMELLLFQEHNMFTLLKYLKFLVDTMRKHNIVWGVGRGSSVSSFVLYLIGIHKINSLYYDLSIDEFIK